ncbi:HEPN domain-containing protein [Micromonospora sp. MSM11]|nr:HEPN domain-containing protein [Micromonospora sp. MSM11]MCL7455947.1 HEPN domain-containing protein [Micromonospora sp. MSM11]
MLSNPIGVALPSSPLDQDLWTLVRPLAYEIDEKISAFMASGKPVPSETDIASVTFREGFQWPDIAYPFLWGDQPDYSMLFKRSSDNETSPYYVYPDLENLAPLVEYIRSSPELTDFFEYKKPVGDGGAELMSQFVDHQAFGLVIEAVSRHRFVVGGSLTDDSLFEIYRQLEIGLLWREVLVDVIVPIILRPFEFESLELTDRISIERLSDDLHAQRLPKSYVDPIPEPVLKAATHAVVLKRRSVPNLNWWDSPGYELPAGILNEVERVFEAMAVCLPQRTGYAQILIRPLGWARRFKGALDPLMQGPLTKQYPPSFDNFGWLQPQTASKEKELAAFAGVFRALGGSNKKLSLAARRLGMGSARLRVEDQVIDYCIGLESLLSDSKSEINYRMSIRLGALVAEQRPSLSAVAFAGIAKKVYEYRSSVAHGDIPKKDEVVFPDGTPMKIWHISEWLLREAIRFFSDRPQLDLKGFDERYILSKLNSAPVNPSSPQASE